MRICIRHIWKELDGGISAPESSMQFLKLLADVVHFENWGGVDSPRTDLFGKDFYLSEYLDEKTLEQIDSVQLFNSLCIVRMKSSANLGLGIGLGFGLEAKVATEAIEAQGSYQSPHRNREMNLLNQVA